MENSGTFTQEDAKRVRDFGQFILEKASWKLTTAEAIQLNKFLIFYNTLANKVDANVMEVSRVINKPQASDESAEKVEVADAPVAKKARTKG
jgi:hypothetical protein